MKPLQTPGLGHAVQQNRRKAGAAALSPSISPATTSGKASSAGVASSITNGRWENSARVMSVLREMPQTHRRAVTGTESLSGGRAPQHHREGARQRHSCEQGVGDLYTPGMASTRRQIFRTSCWYAYMFLGWAKSGRHLTFGFGARSRKAAAPPIDGEGRPQSSRISPAALARRPRTSPH